MYKKTEGVNFCYRSFSYYSRDFNRLSSQVITVADPGLRAPPPKNG